MSDFQRVHCRLCRQTFLTTAGWETGLQRCDACGRTGGLVKAGIAEEEERQQISQHMEMEAKKKKKQPTRRELIGGLFVTMGLVGCLNFYIINRGPVGFYGHILRGCWLTVAALGFLATWLWPKKQPRDQTATSNKSSEDTVR